jgi:hypothetical protein
VSLEPHTSIKDVPLSRVGDNTLRITVLDSGGSPLSDARSELSVFRTLATTDGMATTHTIAVMVAAAAAGGTERNILHPILKKGTPLPSKRIN